MGEFENALVGIVDFAERISGEVTVACVPSAVGHFLPNVIRGFHRLHPRIRVRLLDESSADLLMAVANGLADLGVTYIGTHEADIEFEPLIEDPFVLACSPEHPLAKKKRVAWSDLAGHNYVSLAQGSGNRFLIDQALARAQRKPDWICEVQHVPALISMVEAGIGVGVVPHLALPPGKRLACVQLEDPCVTRTIGIIRRRGQPLKAAAEQFRQLLLSNGSKPGTR